MAHYGEQILEATVMGLFGGKLQLPTAGGGVAQLVPLHWSMSMVRNGSVLLVMEPEPGFVRNFTANTLLQVLSTISYL